MLLESKFLRVHCSVTNSYTKHEYVKECVHYENGGFWCTLQWFSGTIPVASENWDIPLK